jgi:hypothetical protein
MNAGTVDCAYADAAGAGTAPLTWGQRFMWQVIRAADAGLPAFDLFLRHDFDEPIPVAVAVERLSAFIRRHPVLRLSIEVTPDGRTEQRVRPAGVLRVPLLDAAGTGPEQLSDAVPSTTADQMCQMALVADGEAVTGLLLRISHLAADGFGVHLLDADLSAAGDAPPTPSPIALARFEASPGGAAVECRAMAFAEAVYRSCPPTMWPRPRRVRDGHRFRFGQLRSPALLTAMDSLAAARGLSRAGVLVGALAAVAASAAGLPSALMFSISSNRFDRDWRGCPGQLSQEAILSVPVGDTLGATMRTAALEVMRSFQAARYAPETLETLRRRLEWERGACFDGLGSAIVLNLLTDEPTPAVDRQTDLGATTFAWTGHTDQENLGFYLDAFPTATEFVLHARIDTTRLTPEEARDWLYAIEWAVVAASAGDVPTAALRERLGATGASGDVLRAGGERLVAEVTGADQVHTVPVDANAGDPRYVCFVVRPRHAGTPADIHKEVMAGLPAAQPAVAPVEYVVVDAPPADPADAAAWSALPIRARGDGR